ncbi:enoyl-CoA hydratase-related protein [Streptosporangium sp. NPDC001681]|uniref:enoyl-CoA hydratase/isomerase family protein n=1 Tax=Streptosporangium sp. NPDC001681 TaxID=3154395 RepID=UPI003329CC57
MSAPGTPGVAGTGETGAGPALVGYDADRERGVAVLTLDSVANRNALSRPLLDQLTALLRRAAADDAVRVVVLRANGPSFCSGADLAAVRSGAMTPIVEGVVEVQRLVVTMPKPVVARVHGTVRAGGLGLADLRMRPQARPVPGRSWGRGGSRPRHSADGRDAGSARGGPGSTAAGRLPAPHDTSGDRCRDDHVRRPREGHPGGRPRRQGRDLRLTRRPRKRSV